MTYSNELMPRLEAARLLPNEPRVDETDTAHALTQQFLIPQQDNLEAFFLSIRAAVDKELRQAKPVKLDKPYPLGQCLEISLAVKDYLERFNPATLKGAAAKGYAALVAFLNHGGTMRQVWGDLRGQYFQNAFLAGTLYIDVSNDTVVPTKPKVEILPLAETDFSPIKDYVHFSRVASRYWQAHIFPNHLLPSLAPYAPLIAAIPNGSVMLPTFTHYMVAMTESAAFQPSEDVLAHTPMNPDLFQLLRQCLVGTALEVAEDPNQGQELALEYCQKYRAEGLHLSSENRVPFISPVDEVHRRFAQLRVMKTDD